MRSAARWAFASTISCSRRRSPAPRSHAPSTSSRASSSGLRTTRPWSASSRSSMALHSPASAMDDERIARLRAYGVLDPDQPVPALDELVKRAQDVAAFPMAWLSFFDGKRERLRSRAGVAFAYLPRERWFGFGQGALAAPLFVA